MLQLEEGGDNGVVTVIGTQIEIDIFNRGEMTEERN